MDVHGRVSSSKMSAVGWFTLFFQLVFPVTASFQPAVAAAVTQGSNSAVSSADRPGNGDSATHSLFAGQAQAAGSLLSQQNAKDAALNMGRATAVGEVNNALQGWFSQFGTAQLQLNADKDFKFDGSAFDFLMPIYENENIYYFTQLGLRRIDHRTTNNIGLGTRYFTPDVMYGANVFFDNDLTGKNRRLGLGAEMAVDYFKLSTNGYFRLTNWHQSRDFADYDERPANGYDIRAEGWLPDYPQLGASLIYERYFGDEVALFSKDERQKNPHAVTLGVNYTPVPLVTIGANHRAGTGGNNDSQFSLQLNYQIGDSWADHLDSSRVQTRRTLTGSRYDLVNRNNNIVLEYKKQELVKVSLPATVSGHAAEEITIQAQSWSKYSLDHLDWDLASLLAAGGKVLQTTPDSVRVLLPSYRYDASTAANQYAIGVTAYDTRSNVSKKALSIVEVQPPLAQIGDLRVMKNNAIASGEDYNLVQVTLLDGQGQPLPRVEVNFSSDNDAVLSVDKVLSDEQGQASVNVYSKKLGSVPVTVTVGDKQQSVQTEFVVDRASAHLDSASYVLTQDNAWADGGTENQVEGRVIDAWGHPVAAFTVLMTADNEATLKASEVVTDENGLFRASVSSKKAGVASITAGVNGQQQSIDSHFVADNGSAIPTLTVKADGQPANGAAMNTLEVSVVDANDNPVSGMKVNVSASNGAQVQQQELTTNTQGIAQVSVTSTMAGEAVVTIEANARQRTQTIHFIADAATAKLADYRVVQDNVVADGSAQNAVKGVVKDAQGNLLSNLAVNFTVNNGASLTSASAATNASGEVVMTLTNTKAGVTTVAAEVNGQTQSLDTRFIADASTASIEDASFVVEQDRMTANGGVNRVALRVLDAHSNPVPDVAVSFSATNSAQPASSSAQTDSEGRVTMNVTKPAYGTTALTAKAGKSLTKTLTFTAFSGIKNIGISSSGNSWLPGLDAGFPSTAAQGATFSLLVNDLASEAGNFNWETNDAALTVDASGKLTFTAEPSTKNLLITATDKTSGATLKYAFTLKYWAFVPNGTNTMTYAQAGELCAASGGVLPSQAMIATGTSARGIGGLYGEWGALNNLINSYFWSDNSGMHFHQDNGQYHGNTTSVYSTLCMK